MRTSSLAVALLLAGCGDGPSEQASGGNTTAAVTEDDAEQIACIPPGASAFADVCTIEAEDTDGGTIFTVRQPDGGFHRLRLVEDGRGVEAADGAEPAQVTIAGQGVIEVAIGGARYRLPAQVGPLPKR